MDSHAQNSGSTRSRLLVSLNPWVIPWLAEGWVPPTWSLDVTDERLSFSSFGRSEIVDRASIARVEVLTQLWRTVFAAIDDRDLAAATFVPLRRRRAERALAEHGWPMVEVEQRRWGRR